MRERGFTLIELLAVMIVIVAIGSIVAGIIFSSLRGSDKTTALINVRENGDFVISQIAKTVRNARSFDGVSTDDINYTTDCVVASVTPTPTPIPYKFVKITSFDGGVVKFSCSLGTNGTISSNSASLLDTSVVFLDSCSFTCSKTTIVDFPAIGINFALSTFKPTGVINLFPEKKASINFQTTVNVRNLNR